MMARAWGRLFRLSLFPTAVADVLAGLLIGYGGGLPGARVTLLLVGASLCVYHAGMALNDWFDRDHDARTRPDRPIPSGAVSLGAGLAVPLLLIGVGVALAAWASPEAGGWMAGIAVCAFVYDGWGRGPWIGPAMLALCRAGNLALGIVAAGALGGPALAAPLLYGLYVLTVSRLGRLEDGEDRALAGGRPRRLLLWAAFLLVLVAALPLTGATPGSRLGALALCGAGSVGLVRRALEPAEWTPGRVGASMGLALRRLLVFTAACCVLTATSTGVLTGLCLLLGFPISWSLRRSFPPS